MDATNLSNDWIWGPLRRFSPDALHGISLPTEARKFLLDYGLPESYTVNPAPAPEIVSRLLAENNEGPEFNLWPLLAPITDTLLVFAEWTRMPFHGIELEETQPKVFECIERHSGRVYDAVYGDDGTFSRITLVNSSVIRYALSLVRYLRLMDAVRMQRPKDEVLAEFKAGLLEIDQDAMRDLDGRWQEWWRDLRMSI